jgi:hypothetical protein
MAAKAPLGVSKTRAVAPNVKPKMTFFLIPYRL